MPPELEYALITRAQAADKRVRDAAFQEPFVALRKSVLGVCLHITANRTDAEDATQDTFLQVSRALPRFRGDARLSTWVYKIAIRAAQQVKVRRHRRRGTNTDFAVGETASARVQLEQVLAHMSTLSLEHRTVLSLFAIEDLSHREIAIILDLSEGTVWSRLHAARKALAALTA